MLKKSLAFGLLAAGLMVAPGAAFADSQVVVQGKSVDHGGSAIIGNQNDKRSESLNIKVQIITQRECNSRRHDG